MSNEIVNRDQNLPQWMRSKSTGASLREPRRQRHQAARGQASPGDIAWNAPEQPNCASPGEFWLTGQNINLGPEIAPATPIILRKSYVLWNPTKSLDSKVPLAVAEDDGVHWDIPNQTFEVYFPNNRTLRTSGRPSARSPNRGSTSSAHPSPTTRARPPRPR